MRRDHCMIDLETLSTSPNAAVISLAAVCFSPFEDSVSSLDDLPTFHSNVSMDSALGCGLSVDGQTIQFWLKQTKEVQDSLFDPSPVKLKQVIDWFSGWWQTQVNLVRTGFGDDGNIKVWGHGATFDPVILANVFRKCGYDNPPWKYWNVRDTRTLFDLASVDCRKEVGIASLDYFKHNPKIDAQRQVLLVQEAYRKLGIKETESDVHLRTV